MSVFASTQGFAQARTTVRFSTTLGDFNATLFDDIVPDSVDNFLNYVDDGDYNGTIVHRSVTGFIIQGGGFDTALQPIPTDPPVDDNPTVSNLRGTIALASNSAIPNSATSQWFINLDDNAFLDNQGFGFTVIGELSPAGLAIADQIASLPIVDASSVNAALSDLPVLQTPADLDDLVLVNSIQQVPEPASICFACLGLACGYAGPRRRPLC